MITYAKGAFGLNLLWRVRGSCVYRAFVSGFVSVALLLLIRLVFYDTDRELDHPYPVGVLVGSVSFLIVFRANNGYARYWEACGAVHDMISKWMDATTHTACYHMQCDHYNHIKPPSYFDYPELNGKFMTRDRERYSDEDEASDGSVKKSIAAVTGSGNDDNKIEASLKLTKSQRRDSKVPLRLRGKARLDGGWKELIPPLVGSEKTSTYHKPGTRWNADGKGFASTAGGRTPALFLQELAHLASLMNAVALSTLRNDIDGVESPLGIYEPGSPWPEADPDLSPATKSGWEEFLKSFAGTDRSPEARTRYNASRPLTVIGGVSDAEVRFLQMARGPYAKTQLCWQWLSEFIIREHLAGSTGRVGPPIISRVVQFLSDGMTHYNRARKIMYIPFPFPSAQISVFFVIAVCFAIPWLMDQFTPELWLACILTFFSVTCLSGLHEVARELENPFRNVPNDIPICTLQSQYNEALLTMYNGYHPDAWFDPMRRREPPVKLFRPAATAPTTIPENGARNGSTVEKQECAQNASPPGSLRALIESQGREIERLRHLVEGGKNAEEVGE